VNHTYTGWTRLPGQTWQAVVTAPNEDAAWRLLHEHVKQLRVKTVDTFIGPSEIDPRGRRRTCPKRKRFA
jgi:hypothetical protein